MSELQTRLETALGSTYRIEEELGGGGMSFVFLAEEIELGRRVVIKVLPPDMAAGVNKERFQREIKLAASLQHPHIVPLLTAGTAEGDLLYYVMPFIEGESLRAKLEREVELPVDETVRILREVVDALAYAHEHAVVHRDIKPDNVLLSARHALVTDFGVAKAVSASSGDTASGLTSLGMALGTPAYMSPEQAAADPHVDHRADIYALGALAYEMLAGQTPFTGNTAQQLLAAHVSQAPEPVTQHRTTVPPALSETISRCLEKKPADRWQTAAELRGQLDAVATPQTGGVTPTGTQPVSAVSSADIAAKHHPVRVAALFGVAAAATLAVVYALVIGLGLPTWVFLGAVVLLAIGLPIMLVTGRHEQARAVALRTGMHMATPVGLKKHLTWRKAVLGGGLAFGGLTAAAVAFMAMRTLGIGPVGTLVASGVLDEQAPLVLADFVDRTGDSTLADALTEAIRVDLSQSRVVRLMPEGDVANALRRMQRDADATLEASVAREVAIREGAGAVVAGEINRAGAGFVLTARLVAPESGNELAAFRETADDETQIIDAMNHLSRSMRERIGESYKTIRAQGGLDRVTTRSLKALQKYSQALRIEQAGDFALAEDLLEEAVALDSNFAMAWRKLSVVISNFGGERSRYSYAAERAYELRDRLPELERYQTSAFYYLNGIDFDQAIAVYRAGLQQFPDDPTLLANGALALNIKRRYAEAESLAIRGAAYGLAAWNNRLHAQVAQGKFAEAESTVARCSPPSCTDWTVKIGLASAKRDHQGMLTALAPVLEVDNANIRAIAMGWLGASAMLRGRAAEAGREFRGTMQLTVDAGMPTLHYQFAVMFAQQEIRYRNRRAAAFEILDQALERFPLESLDPFDRPYAQLATVYAEAGEVDRAKALLTEYEAEVPEKYRVGDTWTYSAQSAVALAEGRPADAVEYARTRHRIGDGGHFCGECTLYELARAFDAAGTTDSALTTWEKAAASAAFAGILTEASELPRAYVRMGEIYEARGDPDKAVEKYNAFAELWQDADPELRPRVQEIRNRIARLVSETR